MDYPDVKDFSVPRVHYSLKEAEGHYFLIVEEDTASPSRRKLWEAIEIVLAWLGHPCCQGNWFWALVIPDRVARWFGGKFSYYDVYSYKELFQVKLSKQKAIMIDPHFVAWTAYISSVLKEEIGDDSK